MGLAFATAIVGVVVRARRRRTETEARVAAEREARRRAAELAQRRAEEEARAAGARERQAEEEARRAEEEARIATEREARRRAAELAQRRAEEEARAAGERERQAEEEARRAEEEARIATEREAQRHAAEEAQRRAEEEARAAGERERQAEEEARRAEEEARIATEREAQRHAAKEAQRRAEEEARAAGEWERQAEEEARRAEEEARITTEREAQRRAVEEAKRRAEEGARTAAERERKAEEEARRAKEGARIAAEREAQRREAEEAQRRAPQYRPPTGGFSVPRQPPPTATRNGPRPGGDEAAATTRALAIEVRALFDRGGCCRVTLLPKRRAGSPEECAATSINGGGLELVALEEEWYQDVAPEDLGALLRAGTVWASQDTGQEWTLAGREVFVLAGGTTHRGFVSCPRLTLGREHIVLCASTRLAQVEGALQEAGCTNRSVFREEDGAPSGWVLIGDADSARRPQGLVPTSAVPMEEGSDILNVLRPLPEIEISLEGGVPLGYSSWLAGFPPLIRVLGDAQHLEQVLIDGNEATIGEGGGFRAPGWDAPGTHQVWCSNVSRSYSLHHLEQSWHPWPAYVFPPASGSGDRMAICGPLVRPLAAENVLADATSSFEGGNLLQSNPILLGAVPGQVFIATPRRDVRGAQCFACPPFDAVWALPAQPLLCDKLTNRVLLVARPGGGTAPDSSATAGPVSQWCRLILDASRKGLSVEPEAGRVLWTQYKRFARSLWRRIR